MKFPPGSFGTCEKENGVSLPTFPDPQAPLQGTLFSMEQERGERFYARLDDRKEQNEVTLVEKRTLLT